MRAVFRGEIIGWRGPAPHQFVPVPPDVATRIAAIAPQVSYGWGCIAATVTIGGTEFTTSLFPKDGGYLVPVKVAVRRREEVDEGDVVDLTLEIADGN